MLARRGPGEFIAVAGVFFVDGKRKGPRPTTFSVRPKQSAPLKGQNLMSPAEGKLRMPLYLAGMRRSRAASPIVAAPQYLEGCQSLSRLRGKGCLIRDAGGIVGCTIAMPRPPELSHHWYRCPGPGAGFM